MSLVEITTDGTFPNPLKFYSDAILYDVGGGDSGTVTGDGVFTVAQFSNYPYDPFTTLSVTNDWLEVGAERNTGNDTWTVSFRTKNDDLYDITSGVVKLADFVGGVDYPLNSSVVNGLTNIRWGFYDTNIQSSVTGFDDNLTIDEFGVRQFSGEDYYDRMGYASLDLKGNYAVTAYFHGSSDTDYSSKILIFKHNGSSWNIIKRLTFSDTGLSSTTAGSNGWAYSTVLNSTGDKLFVGAHFYDNDNQTDSGAVILFSTSNDWTTVTPTIISLNGSIYEGSVTSNDLFGYTVALSSDDKILIVGAQGYESNDSSGTTYRHGAALVFYTNDNWNTVSEPSNANDGILHPIRIGDSETSPSPSLPNYGNIISIELFNDGTNTGYICAIAVPSASGGGLATNQGLVKIYKSNSTGTVWSHVTDIIQNDTIDGDNTNMLFGYSVDLNEEYLFVGSIGAGPELGGSSYHGAVFIYKTSNYTSWSLVKTINPTQTGTSFGLSVSAYGNNLLVGNLNADYISLYSKYKGGSLDDWGLVQNIYTSSELGDARYGYLCKINDSYVILTEPYNEILARQEIGTIYLYSYSGSVGPTVSYYANANYYKPSGNDNYTTDNTSSSSSGVVTVIPAVSTTYTSVDTTLHTSLYNPDYTAGVDGERVTNISDLSVNGYDYGSVLSLYTNDVTNSLYVGNNIRYNGWLGAGSNVNVIPYTEGSVTVNAIKSITITSASFSSGITYFTNPSTGWYYYQSVGANTGYVTLHFDAINEAARDITNDTYDIFSIADVNVTSTDLDNFIDQLLVPSNGENPTTFTIYYTAVTATSSTDAYFTRYKASQTGYDGIFHFRVKESYKTQNALNPQDHLVNLRGAIVDTGKATFTQNDPDNTPANIDVTEWFGRHFQIYVRFEGKLYIVNGKRYKDGTNSIFPYQPYSGEYDNETWTGITKYYMTSTLFDSGITYFTDVQPGWTYTQTGTSPDPVTLKFDYTGILFEKYEHLNQLIPSDISNGDQFGVSVGSSGNYVIVGCNFDDTGVYANHGSAYIYKSTDNGLIFTETKLLASDSTAHVQFGYACAINGDIAVVTAHKADGQKGRAYVFVTSDSGSTWSQTAILQGNDVAAGDLFGESVAISGNYIVVGCPTQNTSTGSAYIFVTSDNGATWTQQAKLTASDGAADDKFGFSCGIYKTSSTDIDVIIGAYLDDDTASSSGSAYIFNGDGSSWTQVTKLNHSNPSAVDFFGYSVSVYGNYAIVGAYADDDMGSAAGIAIVFRKSGGSWIEMQKLYASDAVAVDFFGISVSIAENKAVIGAYGNDDNGSSSGSSYVFELSGNTWSQIKKFTAFDGDAGDQFGKPVHISDKFIVSAAYWYEGVGTNSGSVYVSNILPILPHEPYTNELQLISDEPQSNDNFGNALGSSGDYVIVGCKLDDTGVYANHGTIFVYKTYDKGLTLTQMAKLAPLNPSNGLNIPHIQFGYACAISGDIIVGSAPSADSNKGRVYIYYTADSGRNWTLSADILQPLDLTAGDRFGESISIYGNYVVVGCPNQNTGRGAAYIFVTSDNGATWTQQAKLTASDAADNDKFGYVCSIYKTSSTDIDVIVGAYLDDDTASASGSAYIFNGDGSSWTQQIKLGHDSPGANDYFGYSVGIYGKYAVVGSKWDDPPGYYNGGVAFVFKKTNGSWSQMQKLYASDIADSDWFSQSVSIAESRIVVGANGNDDNGSLSGSAYVFQLNGVTWSEVKKLVPSDGATTHEFGFVVNISERLVVCSSPFHNGVSTTDSGSAYVFNGASIANPKHIVSGGAAYVAKTNVNIDILSAVMRVPVTSEYRITYSYGYYGSTGTVDQQGYDGIMGTSIHDTWIDPETTPDTYAIDSEKNTIDVQGNIIAAAEGDPHIRPLMGVPYDLPHEEETFLLYSNNDDDYPVSIKAKCWYLPESKYIGHINKYNKIGYHTRAERYLKLFKENTYFKYLEFICGPEQLIIDMERLRPCSLTTLEDFENYKLPIVPYENNDFINLSKFSHSKTGIIVGKKPLKTTLQRVVKLRGKNSIINLRMIWDTRDIVTRNGIEIKIRGLRHTDVGSLVRESVIYSNFSFKTDEIKRNDCYVQEPIKRITKLHTASSYGATDKL